MAVKHKWTAEENEFVLNNWDTLKLEELSKHLNLSTATISQHAKEFLGLNDKKSPHTVKGYEKDYIEAHYYTESYSEMAKALDIPLNRVGNIITVLKKEKRLSPNRKKLAKFSIVGQLKEIKEKLKSDTIFVDTELYYIADEVEAILEVIKERLLEGIE